MRNKVDAIRDFTKSKAFDIKEEIISILRNQLYEPSDDFLKVIKEKMSLLDFLENYTMDDDTIWDWAYSYYGIEEDDD